MHEPAPSPLHTEHVDLLIIGWGKGGKSLAGQVGRAGRRVAVVEQSDLMVGGSCINIACVPTKALIHDAEARRGADPQSWFDAAVARRDTLTRAMRARNHSLLAAVDSVLLVTGTARFTGPREVVVSGLDDRSSRLHPHSAPPPRGPRSPGMGRRPGAGSVIAGRADVVGLAGEGPATLVLGPRTEAGPVDDPSGESAFPGRLGPWQGTSHD